MPRAQRVIVPACPYHAMNRGNGRAQIFHKPADYDAFCRVICEGLERHAVGLFAYCLMPNHWHLWLAETREGQLSSFMSWVGVTHVRRHHEHYHTRGGGHLYQGRFKSFPVAGGAYFRSVAHYVESNPLRAGLCDRAQAWSWSSAATVPRERIPLVEWPWPRPDDWETQLNASLLDASLERVRASVVKGSPYGPADWTDQTAIDQGLTHTLRPPGSPRKATVGTASGEE